MILGLFAGPIAVLHFPISLYQCTVVLPTEIGLPVSDRRPPICAASAGSHVV